MLAHYSCRDDPLLPAEHEVPARLAHTTPPHTVRSVPPSMATFSHRRRHLGLHLQRASHNFTARTGSRRHWGCPPAASPASATPGEGTGEPCNTKAATSLPARLTTPPPAAHTASISPVLAHHLSIGELRLVPREHSLALHMGVQTKPDTPAAQPTVETSRSRHQQSALL